MAGGLACPVCGRTGAHYCVLSEEWNTIFVYEDPEEEEDMGGRKNHRATEARGGDRIDWKAAREGEPLPAMPPDETSEAPEQPGLLDYNDHGAVDVSHDMEDDQ